MSYSSDTPQAKRSQLVLAIAAMTSGIALIVAIVTNTSLGLMLLLMGSLALFTFVLKWHRGSRDERRNIQQKLVAGLLVGLVATAAYDLSRLIVVTIFDMNVSPFKAFPFFGWLIAGEGISETAAYVIGTLYHLFNGVFFSIAYCFAFGRRHWFYGVLWALGLEVAMFVLYPNWLNLAGVMQEFTAMSVTGHVVYGATLGLLCQRWLSRRPSPS